MRGRTPDGCTGASAGAALMVVTTAGSAVEATSLSAEQKSRHQKPQHMVMFEILISVWQVQK